MTLAHSAAAKKVAELEAEVEKLRAEEADAKRHAAASKEHLTDGYWQRRHNAEQRLEAARALEEALS